MIDIEGLDKSFGRLRVLHGLDLRIERGQVTAILGPNASGKTTLIKTILGLNKPDAGRVVFDGLTLNGAWQYRERLGYMPQAACFPDNLCAREVMTMLKDLRGHPTDTDEDLLHAFALEKELNKPLRTLSGGTRQKISAVIAFLFRPDVLILDEPTAGLDPVSSSILKDKIVRERDAGTTFILTSHILSEVEAMADRIAFLLEGQVHYTGSTGEILQRTGQPTLERAIASLLTSGTFASAPHALDDSKAARTRSLRLSMQAAARLLDPAA